MHNSQPEISGKELIGRPGKKMSGSGGACRLRRLFFVLWLLDSVSFINDNLSVYEIRHYLTRSEKDLFMEWRRQLRDTKAKIAIDRRINRMELGNFGDHRFCRDGVWELRMDIGPGYRVYYAMARTHVVLLLCGGDKRNQDAEISRACEYWLDWQGRAEQ